MFLGRSFPSVAAFSMSHTSLLAPFFCGIRPGLLVSTSPAFHVLYSPCHLSTVDWLTPACSQLLTPMFSTHLLNFQTSISLFSCYWSSLGGACCKQSQSYFITSVLQISVCDANRSLHSWCTASIACHDSQACFLTSFLKKIPSVLFSSVWDLLFYVCTTTVWATMAKVVAYRGRVMPQ